MSVMTNLILASACVLDPATGRERQHRTALHGHSSHCSPRPHRRVRLTFLRILFNRLPALSHTVFGAKPRASSCHMSLMIRHPRRQRPLALIASVCAAAGLGIGGAEAAPCIAAPQTTFSFGWRDAEETVTNRFILLNTGDAPLLLTDIRISCGCTHAEPERRQLQPGERTTLEMRLALHGLQGAQRKSVTVISNDPATPSLTFWIEGEARAAVCLEPPSVSFGRVQPQDPPVPSTVLLTGYRTNVTITAATSDNPVFAVSVVPGGRALSLAPPRLNAPGAQRGQVRVTLSDPAQPALSLHLYAWLDDVLRVVPAALAFRPGGEPASTRLVIVRPGTAKRFRITGAVIEGGTGHAEALARPDGSCQIAVQQVIPDTLATNATLLIRTDLPERPEWRVPMRREGHAAPPQ